MPNRCINCGAEIPDYMWNKWYDYCDKCKRTIKKNINNKKIFQFIKIKGKEV